MTKITTIIDHELTEDQIADYRRDGFVTLPGVFAGDALNALRGAVAAAVETESGADAPPMGTYSRIFNQKVNLWQRHPAVRDAATQRRLGRIAARLEGVPMRIWHDQALFKGPGQGDNWTPWHQDAVYWPHADRRRQMTIWIALGDATRQNGCMSFVPGTHELGPLAPVTLHDPADIFAQAPEARRRKAVACPLAAGSATFHNGLTFHYAGPNRSDGMREAYAVIFMPEDTIYDGAPHIVTDPLGLAPGAPLDGGPFPVVG